MLDGLHEDLNQGSCKHVMAEPDPALSDDEHAADVWRQQLRSADFLPHYLGARGGPMSI